jgi:hypothetical protein
MEMQSKESSSTIVLKIHKHLNCFITIVINGGDSGSTSSSTIAVVVVGAGGGVTIVVGVILYLRKAQGYSSRNLLHLPLHSLLLILF